MCINDDTSLQEMFSIYYQAQSRVFVIELYVEFDQLPNTVEQYDHDFDGESYNDEEQEDCTIESDVEDVPNALVSEHPFEEPSFMRALDLDAMNAPEFPEYANVDPPVVKDGEFVIGMEFNSREAVIKVVKDYTIHRGVDYQVFESEPTTFYAKCMQYGQSYDWLIRVSLMRRKYCWEIRRYNGSHTCTRATISQDHSKLDSDTIADAIKPLIEAVEYETLPCYRGDELAQDVRVLNRVFWSFYPCIRAFRHCKPVVQVDDTQLYEKYKGALLVAVSQDGNNNIVPIAFALVEGETSDAWFFFLRHLRTHVVTKDGVGLISDRHESIRSAVSRCDGAWEPPRARHIFCIRHIASNFLRKFKAPFMQKLVVNIGN
ncbi:uncharacterized protein LOC107477049 [Arachis duranensis]|uniref:Uncharacterized protein LOC107477049 n=1 Tax=Arachis duranensis TaxID=130453 RepID=A0A6P4CJC7_ARADU|nr:uncharacterized protein LOC107477049 [Arachis duranensis]